MALEGDLSKLLKERRFSWFFWTQFLGAFTDNVFKNAFVVMLVARASGEEASGMGVTLAQGLFILPLFIFSPLAGQLSDRLAKDQLIRRIKAIEILIMGFASLGFWWENQWMLFCGLFLMGAQSAFFGPVKFSILPQVLKEEELMEGTGLVEMGTFAAILLGTILGGLLAPTHFLTVTLCMVLLTCSVAGFLVSCKIPSAPSSNPSLVLNLNPIKELKELFQLVSANKSIFHSVIGISWFWFYGASVLACFPNFVKFTLGGDEGLITLFLAVFTISIGIGSALCHKLSHTSIEIGLVPFGAIGLTVFGLDLGLMDYEGFVGEARNSAWDFLGRPMSFRILMDLFFLGLFGASFVIPLQALIQSRAHPESCSQVIAANNISNALFMTVSALMLMAFYALGLESPAILLILSGMNLAVAFYIISLVPEFFMRFLIWVLAKTIYRLSYIGREHLPKEGALVLIANHVSFIDWFILTAACQRPVRFVMHYSFYYMPLIHPLLKMTGAIPIAQEKENSAIKEKAFASIEQALSGGDIVCIFPEGAITRDGQLSPFRKGVETIVQKNPVPVLPVAISGLWGSFFSRKKGRAMSGLPKPSRRLIHVRIGELLDPSEVSAAKLQDEVEELLRESPLSEKDSGQSQSA